MEQHGNALSEEEMKLFNECVQHFQCPYDAQRVHEEALEAKKEKSRIRRSKRSKKGSNQLVGDNFTETQINYKGITASIGNYFS